MALLNYNEIVPRRIIEFKDSVYEVISSAVSRKQQNKPVNRVKMRNLFTGSVIENVFHMSDKVKEADVYIKDIKYEFFNPRKGEYWFSDPDNPKNRFTVDREILGDSIDLIPGGYVLRAMYWGDYDEGKLVGIKYPITIDLKVKDAPGAAKGDTATGGTKVVVLETGYKMQVPLFVNTGDVIKVNVEKREYISRV